MIKIHLPENSILHGDNSLLPPRDVFNEVCRLIGNYYADKGFAFFRSRPKLVKKTTDFTTEIAFNSSHSNTAGRYVCLEIMGSLYSTRLAQYDKERGQTYKGYLLGHTDFWQQERFLANNQRTNCNFNVYGLRESGFEEIIEYIDRVFLKQIETLNGVDGIIAFIENSGKGSRLGRENERFYKFIELEYNNSPRIIEALKTKSILLQ